MRRDNITLIGMPGSGKSTLGELLAHELGYQFIDGDEIIESSGRPLQQIIDNDGEEEFLRIEEVELTALKGRRKVFSPGGSCVLSAKAMRHLQRISLVVFLDVPLRILEKRLNRGNLNTRGIVGLREMDLRGLFAMRRSLYLKYAHLLVQLDDRPVRENLNILVESLGQLSQDVS